MPQLVPNNKLGIALLWPIIQSRIKSRPSYIKQGLTLLSSSLFLLITGYTFDNYSGTVLNLIMFSPQFIIYLCPYSSDESLEKFVVMGLKLKDKSFKDLFIIWLYYYVLRDFLIITFDFFGLIYLGSLLKITLFNILFPGFSVTILLGDIDIKLRDYTTLIWRMEEYLSDTIWWQDSFKVSDTKKGLVENEIPSSLLETKKTTVDNSKAKTFFCIFMESLYETIIGKEKYVYYPSAFQKGGLPTIIDSIDQRPFYTSKVSLNTNKLKMYAFSYYISLLNNINLYKEHSLYKLMHINMELKLNVVHLGKEVVSFNGDIIPLGKKVTSKGDIIPLYKKVTSKGDIGLSYYEQLINKLLTEDILTQSIDNSRNLIVFTWDNTFKSDLDAARYKDIPNLGEASLNDDKIRAKGLRVKGYNIYTNEPFIYSSISSAYLGLKILGRNIQTKQLWEEKVVSVDKYKFYINYDVPENITAIGQEYDVTNNGIKSRYLNLKASLASVNLDDSYRTVSRIIRHTGKWNSGGIIIEKAVYWSLPYYAEGKTPYSNDRANHITLTIGDLERERQWLAELIKEAKELGVKRQTGSFPENLETDSLIISKKNGAILETVRLETERSKTQLKESKRLEAELLSGGLIPSSIPLLSAMVSTEVPIVDNGEGSSTLPSVHDQRIAADILEDAIQAAANRNRPDYDSDDPYDLFK